MTVTFATIHLLGGIDFEVSFAQWFANRSSSRPLSANPFRKMSCSDSAAILVPLGRISQEHSNRPAFMSSNEDGIGLDMWRTVVKQAAANWSSHKDARQGAALAYYSVFSLGPIIVIAITIAGLLFGQAAVVSEVMSAIREMLGDTGAKAVEAMLAGASRPAAGILATLLGIGALLFAAIGVVVQQKGALNVVWDVEESEESGLWHFARNYVLSLAAVLALGFLLLVSLLVSAGLAAAGKYAATYVPEAALHVGSMLISFLVVMVLFAMMFKWLPDVTIGWEDVWLGAFLIALFFEIGKAGIGFYIGKQGLESTYGAAASIVVVLIWVYYTSQIILMGAEVTHSYARNNGSLKQRDPETCLAGDDDRTERSYPGTNGDRNKRSSNIPA